jgi:hypothetical protein
MGHDTTAYLGRIVPMAPEMAASRAELGEQIAHVRGDYGQYEALDAQMYDGRVSGIGIGRWFTREQLLRGLEWLRINDREIEPNLWTCRPASRFLETCLAKLPPDQEWVYVDFG